MRKGLASCALLTAHSSGSLAIAPWGNASAAFSLVETPGEASQGTLAPGGAVAAPIFALSHSDHISNGARNAPSGVPPVFPPGSVIESHLRFSLAGSVFHPTLYPFCERPTVRNGGPPLDAGVSYHASIREKGTTARGRRAPLERGG